LVDIHISKKSLVNTSPFNEEFVALLQSNPAASPKLPATFGTFFNFPAAIHRYLVQRFSRVDLVEHPSNRPTTMPKRQIRIGRRIRASDTPVVWLLGFSL